jgi:hypothetical protein
MGGEGAWDHINSCLHHASNWTCAHDHVLRALERICNDACFATTHKRVLTSEGNRRADLEIRNIRVAQQTDLLVDVTRPASHQRTFSARASPPMHRSVPPGVSFHRGSSCVGDHPCRAANRQNAGVLPAFLHMQAPPLSPREQLYIRYCSNKQQHEEFARSCTRTGEHRGGGANRSTPRCQARGRKANGRAARAG